MLGSLPTLADRNFVLGFLLPSLIAAIAVLLFFYDASWASGWLDAVLSKNIETAAYAAVVIWLMATVLLLLNRYVYRAFEGYYLTSLLPSKRARWVEIEAMRLEAEAIHRRYRNVEGAPPEADHRRYTDLRRRIAALPSTEGDLMPTRFGNAIHAFEDYARDVYGADGVAIWLRLMAVAPKDYLDSVQDARTQVDFPLNLSLMSLLVALLALLHLLWHLASAVAWHDLTWLLAAGLCARVFYSWAVDAVPAWGGLVMTAFDCFLPRLAMQLGYDLPATAKERRVFWQEFSEMATNRLYPDGGIPFDYPLSGAARKPPSAGLT